MVIIAMIQAGRTTYNVKGNQKKFRDYTIPKLYEKKLLEQDTH